MYLIFILSPILAVSVIQPSQSKEANFFKWLFQHIKHEQQPQIIEQKIYQSPPKIITQKPVKKQKEESAKRILILGDFVASTIADALKFFFIDNSGIVIINNTMPDSGLVRTDYYSWENNISELIDKNKPDVIAIMVGANDNQPITNPNNIVDANHPEWIHIYKQRITSIAKNLHASRKPWIWIGQPIFKDIKLTQKMKIFNQLYKDITEAEGGYFIDTWDGFIDEQGQFSFSGYGTNGKFVRLRTHDGINFTSEGKKKLSSYLEKKLENILNFHALTHENLLTNGNTLNLMQQTQDTKRHSPMSLDDMAKQNTALLNKIDPNLIQRSWSSPNGHQKDRADNFSFP